jgi:hypothetical protein
MMAVFNSSNPVLYRRGRSSLSREADIFTEFQQVGRSIDAKGLYPFGWASMKELIQLFNMTADQILNHDGGVPKEVVFEDKTVVEQMRLIQQLDAEDRQTIFRLIEKMLTHKKFKEFFQKNAAAL